MWLSQYDIRHERRIGIASYGRLKIWRLFKSNFSGLIPHFSGGIEGKHYRSNHFVFESRYLRFFLDPTCHPNSGFVTFMPEPTHLAISHHDFGF